MRPTADQRRNRAALSSLRKEAEQGAFLLEWLAQSRQAKIEFLDWAESADTAAKEAAAQRAGFRTWRSYLECLKDKHQAIQMFVGEDAFRALWAALRSADPKGENIPWGFSAANAGTPLSILQAIDTWYQTPKFTAAESAKHYRKIAAASRVLIELLEQVSPGGFTQAFDSFARDAEGAERLLIAFRTPAKYQNPYGARNTFGRNWAAIRYLEAAGITPVWAVKQIEAAAAPRKHPLTVLPRKVKSKTAYRTFMIAEVAKAIAGMGPRSPLPVSDLVIADVVALLINGDCSLDDVRKCLASWRAEDRGTFQV